MKRIIICLVLVLTFASLLTVGASAAVSGTRMTPVIEGAVEFNGNYYRIIKESRTWESAKLYCEGMGGHLATVTTPEEDEFCRGLWKSAGTWDCWLGASDTVLEGSWQWVTGEAWSYSNFHSSEPNGDTVENYLGYYHSDGGWNDDSDTSAAFICEWESETLDRAWRMGYVSSADIVYDRSFYYNGHLYKIFEKGKNFAEAMEYCTQLGGHLATVTSPEENAMLYMYMNYRGIGECTLGGGDYTEEGTWQWLTGEEFTYSNWSPDEPNDYWTGEDYIRITTSFGKWNDKDSGSCAYICEWDDICLRMDSSVGDHTFSAWTTVTAATCSGEGQNRRVCSGCGKEETQTIPVLPHTYSDWSITKAPTCLAEGIRERDCTVCRQAHESEAIAILPHAYGDWRVQKEATCTEVGKRARVCESCLGTEEGEIDILPHTYGEYKDVKGNALFPPILRERTCASCGGTDSYECWDFVWVPIVVIIGIVGAGIGIFSYIRAFKHH